VSIRFPSAVDYTLALQHPDAAFSGPALRGAVFTSGFMGPECIAGSSAVVFRADVGGTEYAVRCYTREDASSPDRYAALDTYVTVARLRRYVGAVTWYEQEVLVKGLRWPVLTMEWIAGRHLNEYVGDLVDDGDTDALRSLASQWLALVDDLQQASFAHGDLQHGNVLVDADGQLRLVDFDSVWIPPLRGRPAPAETGHPSYQPPGITATGRWGPYMDTFPGLVIYLALTALAKSPELWEKLNNGDNLLFERRDFVRPHDTEAWTLLAGLADPETDRLAARLRQFCAPGQAPSMSLRDAISGEGTGPEAARLNWWERTGATPARPPAPPAAGMPPSPRFNPVHTQVVYQRPALPPPSAAYQRPGPVPGTGPSTARRPGPAAPLGIGTWQEPEPLSPVRSAGWPQFTPVKPAKRARNTLPFSLRHQTPLLWAQRGLGIFAAFAGLVLSGLFAGDHQLVLGIALGTVLVIASVTLIMLTVNVKR
jgi:hypothetical protein